MKNLAEYRRKRGLQRKFVATKVGICGEHLNDIEAGRVNLTNNVAEKLANVYDLAVDDIRNMYGGNK